jgi:hypothetical protein
VVDLVPEDTEPLEENDSSEDVVAGRSSGSQSGGAYHGRVTLISALGIEIPGVTYIETEEGETNDGPLGPLNAALGDICTGSGNTLCLSVLDMNSSTDENGSENSFSAANVNVGAAGNGISASALESEGNISDDGTCQTSEGSSSVADANALNLVTADLLGSESTSEACNDGSSDSQTNTSNGLNVLGTGLPLPQAGCENGTPNTVFNPVLIGSVVSAVCNADDSNGSQADDPYGVREALSVFVLPILGNSPLAKATTAAGESAAQAPEGEDPACPDPTNPDCDEGPECPDASNPDCPDGGDGTKNEGDQGVSPSSGSGSGGPGGPNGPSADADATDLPFTGADALTLGLVGAVVMGLGLLAMALADRRRKASA